MSLRDKIFAADDRQIETVEVPEWGCSVGVRVMGGAERDTFEYEATKRMTDDKLTDPRGLRSRLLVATLVDEEGQPVFTSADIPAIEQKAAPVISRLCEVAQRVNGLSDEDVEELAKNSSGAPNGDSG